MPYMMPETKKKAIVIGGSAGSVKIIYNLLKILPNNFPIPIIIALHRPEEENSHMGELFKEISTLPVIEPSHRQEIESNMIYLAPSGYHIVIETDYTINIDKSPLVHYSRPSIDVLFLSAAEVYKNNLLGVILTGSNEDGAMGSLAIKQNEGVLIVQDPKDAAISRMPLAAISKTEPDLILNKEQLYSFMLEFAKLENYNLKINGFRIKELKEKL